MAINVFDEQVMRLTEAARLLPKSARGNTVHLSTMHRWIQRGIRCPDGSVVRLESVKVGCTTFTSQEALQRFFDRISGDPNVVTPPTESEREMLRRAKEAGEAGVLTLLDVPCLGFLQGREHQISLHHGCRRRTPFYVGRKKSPHESVGFQDCGREFVNSCEIKHRSQRGSPA